MREEQKENNKIEDYKEALSYITQLIDDKKFLMGLAAAGALISFMSMGNDTDINQFFDLSFGFVNVGISSYQINSIQDSMIKKNIIQNKIKILEEELRKQENAKRKVLHRSSSHEFFNNPKNN